MGRSQLRSPPRGVRNARSEDVLLGKVLVYLD
jgi:hypothetical protein